MAADDTVILLGEDIADPSGGVFKVTKGLSTKYGTHRVRATPIAEQAIVGAAIGPRWPACARSPRSCSWTSSRSRWTRSSTMPPSCATCPAARRRSRSRSAPTGGRQPLRRPARAVARGVVLHTPGMKVVIPSTPADAKGLLTVVHLRRRPVPVHRAPEPGLRQQGRGTDRRPAHPARQRQHRARGHRRHADHLRPAGLAPALPPRRTGRGGHQRRGHRPAHARCRSTSTPSSTR